MVDVTSALYGSLCRNTFYFENVNAFMVLHVLKKDWPPCKHAMDKVRGIGYFVGFHSYKCMVSCTPGIHIRTKLFNSIKITLIDNGIMILTVFWCFETPRTPWYVSIGSSHASHYIITVFNYALNWYPNHSVRHVSFCITTPPGTCIGNLCRHQTHIYY